MEITIKGTTTDGESKEAKMSLEYLGKGTWKIKASTKDEFQVTELEKTMAFLKSQVEEPK